ncbi:MAG TPA: hypothetical protein VD994_13160, partial [Prosthecobacter sp.]|nr:hypothetical protein [Prosthecobacter sp.]
YWVKNNDLQFLVVRLPKGARLASDVFVKREPQQPMRREGSDDLLVRLPAAGAGDRQAFPVRLVFEVPSPKPGQKLGIMGSLQVFAPELAEVGILETRHRLYLPEGWHYTSVSGPLTRTARDRGWARARRLIDPLIPAFGPQLDTLENAAWSQPPQVEGDTRSLYGLQIPQQGHLETLRRLGTPAEMRLGFRSKKMTFALEAAAFLAALLAGWWVWRQPLARRALFVLIFGFGAMLLTGLVGPANVPVLIASMLGVLLVLGVWFAQYAWRLPRGMMRWITRPRGRPPASPPPPAVPEPPSTAA